MRRFAIALAIFFPACGNSSPSTITRAAPAATSDAPAPAPLPENDTLPDAPDASDQGSDAAPASFSCSGKTGTKGDLTLSLASGGNARTSLLHVPTKYDPSRGAMLVINFHGFQSDAVQEELLTHMNDESDARGFLVAYPYGIGSGWNAGDCCTELQTTKVDDVQLTRDLLALIQKSYCIDPDRIYATGMSNGGFMTHRLACEMAGTFAAFAPVAGVIGIPLDQCNPARAVPILHFHGTADGLVPYDGGYTTFNPLTQSFLSVPETTTAWRKKNGCLGAPVTTYAKGDATCVQWGGCDGAGEVNLCTISGGGHTWPGGLAVPTLGKTSADVDATRMMIDFFEAHPKR